MYLTEQGKVTIQLKYGGKRFNRFNVQIIYNNNRKNDEILLIFRRVIAKNNFN